MTYEYLCTACGHDWEAEQSISASPLKTCPSCGQDSAKRQVSGGAGFILKGSGWYADLYSSKKPEKSEKGEKSEKSESTETKKTDGATTSSSSDGAASTTSSSTTGGTSTSAATAPSTPKQGGASAS